MKWSDLGEVGDEHVPVDPPTHAQLCLKSVGGERGGERHVWPGVQPYGLVYAPADENAAVAVAAGQVDIGFVDEHETDKI